ncbi:MAG: hypothetical protein GY896_07130 [Gammaproteobacteria bacterium]|nr:hypothetical protein [Gammaproteobacteria bacterium]
MTQQKALEQQTELSKPDSCINIDLDNPQTHIPNGFNTKNSFVAGVHLW